MCRMVNGMCRYGYVVLVKTNQCKASNVKFYDIEEEVTIGKVPIILTSTLLFDQKD